MLFRPSQAGYWSSCAAFVRFTQNMPETSGDAAREGTCAAWVGDETLTGVVEKCADMLGRSHVNGWVVDSEMVELVQEYVNTVRSLGGVITAEEFVQASADPLIQGTLDSSVTLTTNGILKIIDLKYGRRVVENTAKQIVCYGWGKFLKAPPGTIHEIHLSIYQPRAVHSDGIYRTRVITPAELHSEFTELWNMAVEGQRPDSLATPGAHCIDCQAASGCEALAHTAYNLVSQVTSRNHKDLSPHELSKELNFAQEAEKTITARFKAVRAEAEARMKQESIPGWKLEHATGHRKFTVSGQNVQLLTGVDPWEKKLCTPAELGRRGVDDETLKMITKKPNTGQKLVKVKNDDIAKMFKE